MSVFKRALALVLAIGMVAMFFNACERNITKVVEVCIAGLNGAKESSSTAASLILFLRINIRNVNLC